MRILDKEKIKQIKISRVRYDNEFRQRFIDYKDNKLEKEEISELRKENKNFEYKVYYKWNDISTFVTYNNKHEPIRFDTKESAYKFVLKRIAEKIRESRKLIYKKDIRDFNGIEYVLIGGVHNEPGLITRLADYDKIQVCFREKKPRSKQTNYVGLEFEFYTTASKHDIARELVKANLHNKVYVKYDLSIHPDADWLYEDVWCGDCQENYDDGGYINDDNECDGCNQWLGAEVCLISTEKEVCSDIKKITQMMFNVNAQVNETCGLHVHLDMRNRDHKLCFSNLVAAQDMLFSLVNSDREVNQYCQKISTRDFDMESPRHYTAINGPESYNRRKTIEVRIHQGTTELKEIQNWVKLLMNIVNLKEMVPNTLNKSNITDDGVKEYYWGETA